MKTLLAVLVFVLFVTQPATALQYGDFTYFTNRNAVTITGYTGAGGNVAIPQSIDGLPVVALSFSAFGSCCTITNVSIPFTLKQIETRAFEYCSGLLTITIPAGVTNIGLGCFRGCSSLAAITVEPANPYYCSQDGVMFNKAQSVLKQYPGGMAADYVVPASVRQIELGAFEGCTQVTGIHLPNGFSIIPDRAFEGCTSLTHVTLPDGLTAIGKSAFYGCLNLTRIALPDSMVRIGDSAFANAGLREFPVAARVVELGIGAFWNCALTQATIPASVKSIGNSAFENCLTLTNVTIPGGVTNIGRLAFSRCVSLLAINVDPENQTFCSIDGALFDQLQHTLLRWPGGKGGSYRIPTGVKSLADDCFNDSLFLNDIWLPSTVETIGIRAFYSCPRLRSIEVDRDNSTFASVDGILFDKAFSRVIQCPDGKTGTCVLPSNVTTFGSEAFVCCANLKAIYCKGDAPTPSPSSLSYFTGTIYYLPGTTGWEKQLLGHPAALWLPGISIAREGGGTLKLIINWSSGMPITVEASTNLTNATWVPLHSCILTYDSLILTDLDSTSQPARFYRVRSL